MSAVSDRILNWNRLILKSAQLQKLVVHRNLIECGSLMSGSCKRSDHSRSMHVGLETPCRPCTWHLWQNPPQAVRIDAIGWFGFRLRQGAPHSRKTAPRGARNRGLRCGTCEPVEPEPVSTGGGKAFSPDFRRRIEGMSYAHDHDCGRPVSGVSGDSRGCACPDCIYL